MASWIEAKAISRSQECRRFEMVGSASLLVQKLDQGVIIPLPTFQVTPVETLDALANVFGHTSIAHND